MPLPNLVQMAQAIAKCTPPKSTEIAPLKYVYGVDDNGCAKFQLATELGGNNGGGTGIVTACSVGAVAVAGQAIQWLGVDQTGCLVRDNIRTSGQITGNGTANSPITFSETALIFNDTSTIDGSASGTNGHTVSASLRVAAAQGNVPNALTVVAGQGVYVPAGAGLVAQSTPTITHQLSTAAVLQSSVNISAVAGNIVQALADGLYVPPPTAGAAHNAAVLSNSAAPFSWDVLNQNGNIPQVPSISISGTNLILAKGDGTNQTVALPGSHAQAVLTNNKSAFSWDTPTQIGNIPQAAKLSISGSNLTLDRGDGNVDTVAIPGGHPSATLSQSAAPFAWNGTTQVGNIPAVPSIALSGSNLTLNKGDGTQDTVTLPGGHAAASLTQSAAPFTWNVATQIGNIPALPNISIQGSNLTLSRGDGTNTTVTLPTGSGSGVTSVNASGGIIGSVAGNTVTLNVDLCALGNTLPASSAPATLVWLNASGCLVKAALTVGSQLTGTGVPGSPINPKIDTKADNALEIGPNGGLYVQMRPTYTILSSIGRKSGAATITKTDLALGTNLLESVSFRVVTGSATLTGSNAAPAGFSATVLSANDSFTISTLDNQDLLSGFTLQLAAATDVVDIAWTYRAP